MAGAQAVAGIEWAIPADLAPSTLAEGLRAAYHAKDVATAMHEAVEQGVRFMACSDALRAQGLTLDALIPECRGHGGAVQYMARAADRRWRTLVF